jgi:uncharacterized protein (DUF927 family)
MIEGEDIFAAGAGFRLGPDGNPDPIDPAGSEDDEGDVDDGAEPQGSVGRNRNFHTRPDGVYKVVELDDGTKEYVWICSPLGILAETRDADGQNWGRLLEVEDLDGTNHRWAMPMSMLATDGADCRRVLLSMGLRIAHGASVRPALLDYMMTWPAPEKVRCVDRVGWHETPQGDVFVLPDVTFGATATTSEEVLLQTERQGHSFHVAGTLGDWIAQIGVLCVGNSRLVLAVSAAFAAVLLRPADAESGGINLFGLSGCGKTTTLKVGCSVWGGGGLRGYVNQWRGTANGIEGIAAAHCDALLGLDEMGQVDAREAGEIAYMLANGTGKARARREGGLRAPMGWRVLFLSTGELTLGDKMQEAGKQAKAGQEVRLIDIPADAGAGKGVFENLHHFGSADALARHLADAAKRVYGCPIRAFVERIATTAKDEIGSGLQNDRNAFISKHALEGASGQVLRVASRLALIASAGELATSWGITGWAPGEAERAVAKCLKDWLRLRGGSGDREVSQAIAQVRMFISQHGSARFETPWDTIKDGDGNRIEQRIPNRAGFKRRKSAGDAWEYLIPTDIWRTEICKGCNSQRVARALADQGHLISDQQGKLSISIHIPHLGQMRVYRLRSSLLDGGPGDE